MSRCPELALALALLAAPAAAGPLGLGRPALPEEVAAWDIDVRADGTGLPEGQGSVAAGEALFSERCAVCHGDFGEGTGRWPVLAGGQGTLTDPRPVRSIGSYWPVLSTVWDYVHRAQPFVAPRSLDADETYALVAYLLYLNDLVDEEFTLSRTNFTSVVLPNAGGFYADDRDETEVPLFSRPPCMVGCKAEVRITGRAATLGVTPAAEAVAVPAAPPVPVPDAPDAALVALGERVFSLCAACHQTGPGAANGAGPALFGVVGHLKGAAAGFAYSPAFVAARAAGERWTAEGLAAYLVDPAAAIPGTAMGFDGLRSVEEAEAAVAYLQSLVR